MRLADGSDTWLLSGSLRVAKPLWPVSRMSPSASSMPFTTGSPAVLRTMRTAPRKAASSARIGLVFSQEERTRSAVPGASTSGSFTLFRAIARRQSSGLANQRWPRPFSVSPGFVR